MMLQRNGERLMRAIVAVCAVLALCGATAAWAQTAHDGTRTVDPGAPPRLLSPTWLQRPSAEDFSRYVPEAALVAGVSGRVVLDCIVGADGSLTCTVASQDPEGYGFGDAGLLVARHFRMAPTADDGAPTEGGRVRVPVRFVVPERGPPPNALSATPERGDGAELMLRYYPVVAEREGVEGHAVLECEPQSDQTAECNVVSESPAGYGFGHSALLISRHFRVPAPTRGSRAGGGSFRRTIHFTLPE
jgi:TonB family protein